MRSKLKITHIKVLSQVISAAIYNVCNPSACNASDTYIEFCDVCLHRMQLSVAQPQQLPYSHQRLLACCLRVHVRCSLSRTAARRVAFKSQSTRFQVHAYGRIVRRSLVHWYIHHFRKNEKSAYSAYHDLKRR